MVGTRTRGCIDTHRRTALTCILHLCHSSLDDQRLFLLLLLLLCR
jgi:hypothetical protein